MTSPLLELRGVRFAYFHDRPVLDGVDLALHAGERIALCGANGSGKTSLLHLLVGLIHPEAGAVHAFGQPRQSEHDFRPVRARAGLLFQDPDDQLFCPTVAEDVAFGPLNLGLGHDEAAYRVEQTLNALGLHGYGERITWQLSGGEKRLVSLAAVLAMEPEVLLLDEPSNGLDEAAFARLVAILNGLDQAMLLVSHDARLIEALGMRRVWLRAGRIETQ